MPDHPEPAFVDGLLDVGDGHTLYWRSHGRPDGPVVVILHGGPGAGHNPRAADFFDPAVWRVVLYDQRGAGRSTPEAATEHNDTVRLVADMERLRLALGIDRWLLFGGSWGTRLALAYGIAHADRCTGFLLRGVFLGRQQDIDWFLWGVRRFFPDRHAALLDMVEALAGARPRSAAELLTLGGAVLQPGHPGRAALALAWDAYETAMITVRAAPPPSPRPDAASSAMSTADATQLDRQHARALALSTIEHHYMAHVLPHDRDPLGDIAAVAHLPCEIVHGRYDVICPLEQATSLASLWPAARLSIAEVSGHWQFAPEVAALLHAGSARLLERVNRTAADGSNRVTGSPT